MPLVLASGIVLCFYALDCLYAERKDRSILFWKSLPVSDALTVGAKLLVALVVAPLLVFALAIATHLVFEAIIAVRMAAGNLPPVIEWSSFEWLRTELVMLLLLGLAIAILRRAWDWESLMLLGGIGLLLAAFGRWNFLGWHGRDRQTVSFRAPDQVVLTPGQKACAWFFLTMAALFLIQTLVGGASQHYRADLGSFFGIDLGRLFPYNIARTWHLQLAIFWVATSYLAAGIFLVPMITGHEPRGQHILAYGLLGALARLVRV